MGEKHKVETEEDEKKWEKLIQYYRTYCIRTYKDNPKNWHKECKGRGFVERGSYGVLHVSSDGCQGKGYTELEPESIFESGAIKTNQTITLSGGYKNMKSILRS